MGDGLFHKTYVKSTPELMEKSTLGTEDLKKNPKGCGTLSSRPPAKDGEGARLYYKYKYLVPPLSGHISRQVCQ